MPGQTSGLQRDLRLVRRRAWLFLPFFVLGILASLALGSLAGQANAVATMQLDTVVHDTFVGGDRGLRIFEAQSMTGDAEFKQKVIAAIGDPNFDYARYSISLNPISIADGVSRGILTVSIKDDSKTRAEALRQAWVDVFTQEYTAQDGLFRRRFVEKRQGVADVMEALYQAAYKGLQDLARSKGVNLPLDELAVRRASGTLIEELNQQEAGLQAELADVQSALNIVSSAKYSAEANATIAAATLQIAVAGDPRQALAGRQAALEGAIAGLRKVRADLSDGALDPEILKAIDNVRAIGQMKVDAYGRLVNARAASVSAESTIETSYSFSGGLAGTVVGRVAVVLAVTIVFGLIAIYTLEWLSQVRAGTQE